MVLPGKSKTAISMMAMEEEGPKAVGKLNKKKVEETAWERLKSKYENKRARTESSNHVAEGL